MYVIKVDGQEIYSPALNEPEQQLLSISLQLEIDTAGSLSFIIPPGHAAHNSIHKLQSVVTMEWDGVEIFRGRVLEEKTDAYNQKEVYCEGDLAYLMDSVIRPFTFEGTVKAFVAQVIAIHNEQVEEYKQFTMGDFSALTDETVIPLESDGYSDTLSAIRAVLETHEGYLFTRYENGVRYLDYVTAYDGDEGQTIEFGVNLLDLDSQTAAEELCTVLLPIGAMLEDGTTVTIASVNNGKDTIKNARAISQYGRIVKTYAFDDVTDPAVLLQKAREKLDSMSFVETLILRAVDMHFLDEEKGIILPGKRVLIHTAPHGIDNVRKLCTALDLDPENPEKATYTFGKPEKTQSGAAAMIASQVEKHTRTVQKLYKHYTETDYTVKIHAGLLDSHDKYISQAFIDIDGINAKLLLKADKSIVDAQGERLSSAEVAIDGANAAITLKADRTIVDEYGKRISQAEIDIDGANAAIALKADRTVVDDYGKRLSNAEIAIDGANAAINLKANQTTVEEIKSDVGKAAAQMESVISRVSQAEIDIDGAKAAISLKASQEEVTTLTGVMNETITRVSNAEIDIDGAKAAIALKADQSTVDTQGKRLSSAEVAIDGANATIRLKADQTTVDAQGKRISTAEIAIDGANGRIDANAKAIALKADNAALELANGRIDAQAKEIALKANKIDLDGYVTMSAFNALQGEVNQLFSDDIVVNGGVTANFLTCGTLDADNLTFGLIAGKNPDDFVLDIIKSQSALTLSGNATVATQSWVSSNYIPKANLTTLASQQWVGANYATKASLDGYQLKTGLTTKTYTVVTNVDYNTATTPPFYNGNGTQVSSGIRYVKGITKTTQDITVVVYA